MPARPPSVFPDDLRQALRTGRRDDVVGLVHGLSPADRRRLRPALKQHHDLIIGLPDSARAPQDEWVGPLRSRHWSAAAAALLACSTLEQATRYWPLDLPGAADLPRLLFPDHLEVFVEEWSARYLRDPKAWDRIRGLEAMFDWAHQFLVRPPDHPGAVLLLASMGGTSGTHLLRYLEDRPVLIATTFWRIFDVPGVPGASLAQIDDHRYRPGSGIGDFVVPQLIRRGHWQLEQTLAATTRAAGEAPNDYQRRHWSHLVERLKSIPPS